MRKIHSTDQRLQILRRMVYAGDLQAREHLNARLAELSESGERWARLELESLKCAEGDHCWHTLTVQEGLTSTSRREGATFCCWCKLRSRRTRIAPDDLVSDRHGPVLSEFICRGGVSWGWRFAHFREPEDG